MKTKERSHLLGTLPPPVNNGAKDCIHSCMHENDTYVSMYYCINMSNIFKCNINCSRQ